MNQEENILGYEKIGKLIRKFSIPCIISLLVNSLYNIVDQIFIGWKVGYLGNGATNVVFPLVMICLAFSLMLGDGSSAFLSLKLGQKKQSEAGKGVCSGFIMSILISILFFIGCMLFLPQILNLFGCTEAIRPFALDYGYIVVIGLPFMIIGTTLNSIIRADGNPKYSMSTMIIGAVLNVILDAVLLFGFNLGVRGAAIATAISQAVTAILNVCYLKKFKSVSITKETLKLDFTAARNVIMLGISSFITQMSIVFVIACENNLLVKYGAQTEFGSDIPITVLGIVMKISQILNSIIIGISAGAQPIIGFNYGARKYDRVKQAYKTIIIVSLTISTIAFLLFQLIPDKLIAIFGSGDETYVKFACLAFRTYLLLCICNGIQIPSGIFFQAIGKSLKSATLSLSRQIVFLIPGMIILGQFFGLKGVLYAGPAADGLAFVVAMVLLFIEFKHMGKAKNVVNNEIKDVIKESSLDKHTIITISREYGSGGSYIGKLVADKLGIKLYDKDFVKLVAEKTGLSSEFIENNEQKRGSLDILNSGYYAGLSNADELFNEESNLIKEYADKESCVIIGRCSDFVLKDRDDVINIFIYGDADSKVSRAVKEYGLTEKEAVKMIKSANKQRANHYKYYTGKVWGDKSSYDICINSSTIGIDEAVNMICKIVAEK